MLRKLATFFHISQPEKTRQDNDLNKKISGWCLDQSLKKMAGPERQQMIEQLKKGWSSSLWRQKLRYLIVTHHIIRNTFDEELIELYSQQTVAKKDCCESEGTDAWVSRQLVDYYSEYLQKLCNNIEMFKEFKLMKEATLKQLMSIELTASCFKAVNLLNFILKTQVNLNKVGRYYPKLMIMGQLFNMYVEDIKVFYHQLHLITNSIMCHYQQLSNEMLRHSYVFLVEVQKVFDRLQQFFYNRYFYRSVDATFPQITYIDPVKYKQLVKYIRLTDINIDIKRVTSLPTRRNRPKFNDTCVDTKDSEHVQELNQTVFPQRPEELKFQERFATEKDQQ